MLFVILLILIPNCYAIEGLKEEKINYRLPNSVYPIRYQIQLEPNLESETFTGSVKIELSVTQITKNITMHANKLNISENDLTITRKNGLLVPISHMEFFNDGTDFWVIYFQDVLTIGSYLLIEINKYDGLLVRDNAGFYLAIYHDDQGYERRLATTQFQSIGARRAFPCFDEPHMKARFTISLIRKGNYISNSNEKLINTRALEDNRYEDKYQETVVMSSYLVAFIVSDYNFTDEIKSQRVFSDKASIKNGETKFAHDTGVTVLGALEHYFGTNFTLNKLDQVAIPDGYFAPGAMENWGMVTYRKSILVYPFDTASLSQIQKTVTIISHEYAHHWFGNLVTAEWWKYIWLNEGFARYFQYFGASIVRPEWRLMDQFVVDALQLALHFDGYNFTEPMNYEAETPGRGPLNIIAYEKSGSVIRMINHFLTENIFKEGLKLYLYNNLFGTVRPSILYKDLQTTLENSVESTLLGNLTVSQILSTRDSLPGYPVVRATRNQTTGAICLVQERFFYFQNSYENNQTWYIPINFFFDPNVYNNSNSTTASFWLTKKIDVVNNDAFPTKSWFILNKHHTGYYRVNYDLSNWVQITYQLNNKKISDIPVLNRAQLIGDSFNLARSGLLDYKIPLTLSLYLKEEKDYIPFRSYYDCMEFIKIVTTFSEQYKDFQKYINNVLKNISDYLGFEEKLNDQHLDKRNREYVINFLSEAGNPSCRNFSLNKLKLWKGNKNCVLNPNLEDTILCSALRTGDADDWNFVYNQYKIALNTPGRVKFLKALGCSENATILNSFMNAIVENTTDIPSYDLSLAFTSIYKSSKIGLSTCLEFIENNFEEFKKTLEKSEISTIIEEIGSVLTTNDQLNRLMNLSAQNVNEKEIFDKAIRKTKENIDWIEEYFDAIREWFENYQ